ncbi:hypothetical protein [Aquimarina longa]|uniref:hypothetical protein n=1 Tax=Aquimarina longa TaxID=1080221 RepID=UPI0007829BB4|nr:hypothetical protein [Aquimarina longa]
MVKYNKHQNDRTNYPQKHRLEIIYNKDRNETLGEMLIRRNHLLILLFERIQEAPIELYGKAEAPMIILNRKIKLTAFVKKFKLNFTNSPRINSEVVYTMTINATAMLEPFTINEFIQDYEQEDWGQTITRLLGKKTFLEEKYKENFSK